MDSLVEREWDKVQDVKSLYKYYPSQSEYQKWHNRFVRYGKIVSKKRGSKGNTVTLCDVRQYKREWYKRNKDKATEHIRKYWAKRLEMELNEDIK